MKRRLRVASKVLADSREELARADGKASILLAAIGVVVGALMAGILANNWSPFAIKACFQWLWWVGNLLAAFAVFSLAWAIYPRTVYRGQRDPGLVAYFGDVIRALRGTEPGDRRVRIRKNLDATSYEDLVIDQMTAIAWIIDRKYRGIQRGLWSAGAAAVACLVAFLLNLIP